MEVPAAGIAAGSCLVGGGCYWAAKQVSATFHDPYIERWPTPDRPRTVTPYARAKMMSKDEEEDKIEESDNDEKESVMESESDSVSALIRRRSSKKKRPSALRCGF
eukprot:GEMP01059792.1.p2 GENE.GEMP01059792.1~~GEMP01059792.1.p2  ORF type:complete len:106 (+),score=22.77 GEMP01059792.1:81-398(+)